MPRGIRKTQVPGQPKLTDEPMTGAGTAAELADYESETLPEQVIPSAQELLAEMLKMRGEIARLQKRAQTIDETRKENPGVEIVSEDEARAQCEAMIKAGKRPRAILTPSGWYVHPHMARTPQSLSAQGHQLPPQ